MSTETLIMQHDNYIYLLFLGNIHELKKVHFPKRKLSNCIY